MREGFLVFDAHSHIGTARHSGRRVSAEDMLRNMDRAGIDCGLLIPFPVVEDERAAHDEIAAAIRQHPGRFAGAACIHPFTAEADYRDEARRCREKHGFAALKVQPQYHGLNPMNPAHWLPFRTAQELGMALIWHTGAGTPFALPALLMPAARAFPDLKIIAAHCGGNSYVSEAIVAALFCPNIYLELSTLMPNHVREVVAQIPPARLMAGSDLMECAELEMAKIVALDLPREDRQQILAGTAQRVFGGNSA